MFNRSLNRTQFPELGLDDLPAAPAQGGPPTHRGTESIPFAGGSFIARPLEEAESKGFGANYRPGVWNSMSGKLNIPGTLSPTALEYDDGEETRSAHPSWVGEGFRAVAHEFQSTPEEAGRGDEHADYERGHARAGDYLSFHDTTTGPTHVSAAVGYHEKGDVPVERLGEFIRDSRATSEGPDPDEQAFTGHPGRNMVEENIQDAVRKAAR